MKERIVQVDVTKVSRHGIWLLCRDREMFLSFKDFPWFKDAPVASLFHVEEPSPNHFYWPDLDVDLSLRTIEDPQRFPLVANSMNALKQPTEVREERTDYDVGREEAKTPTSVPMLKHLRLDNYRSFRSESVDLDNPTFLVGQNGAGKSNFVDAISFLAEAMASSLSMVFHRRSGFERVVHRGGKSRLSTIGFHLKLQDLNDHTRQATYDLVLRGRRDYRLEIVREHCMVEGPDGSETTFNRHASRNSSVRWSGDVSAPKLTSSTLALSLIGDSRFEPVFHFLANMRTYRIDPLTLRSDHEQYGNMELDEDGSNAARVLRRMEKKSPEDWKEVCELLASAVPGLADVQARRRNGELTLEFLQNLRTGRTRFDAADMSDGTLRALGILVAAYQHPAPSLIVIEEPEASIHPGALGVVLDVLRDARRSSQIVVTTHSPDVLDAKWIKDRHLRLVSWDEGITRIDTMAPSVRRAMAEQLFGAGELLRSNALQRAERT